MRRTLAWFVAILGAALLPALIMLVGSFAQSGQVPDVRDLLAYGLLLALLCLLPAALLLRRLGWLQWWTLGLVGFAAVFIVQTINLPPGSLVTQANNHLVPMSWSEFLYGTTLAAAFGEASGIWFWFAIRNQSALPPSTPSDVANQKWRAPIGLAMGAVAAAAMPTVILGSLPFFVVPAGESGELMFMIASIFVLALAHAVVFGVPIAWWLRRMGWMRVVPMAVMGAIVGSVPYGLYSFQGVLIEMLSTLDGWMALMEETGMLAMFGVLGGLAFLGVFRAITGERGTRVAA